MDRRAVASLGVVVLLFAAWACGRCCDPTRTSSDSTDGGVRSWASWPVWLCCCGRGASVVVVVSSVGGQGPPPETEPAPTFPDSEPVATPPS